MYRRVDYFCYFDDQLKQELRSDPVLEQQYKNDLGESTYNDAMDNDQVTDWSTYLGFSIKGGANYNLSDNHNLFLNTGYFARQPDFRAAYLNYQNILNEDAVNEKVFSFELGYGFRTGNVIANVNAYHTRWMDKTFIKTQSVTDPVTSERIYYTANILGVDAVHQGVELDFVVQPLRNLDVRGMVSIGGWKWLNDIKDVDLTDDSQNVIGTYNLYIAGVHVGDAAQTTFALGVDYELLKGFKVGADYNYYDRHFADFDPLDRSNAPENGGNPDSWELPAFGLFDFNLRYDFKLAGVNTTFFGKINNVFNTEYVSDAYDGSSHDWDTAKVYYGWGRSWSFSLMVSF